MSSMTPQEIVSELDRHIVGQKEAKRAVAIALRNRWRRQQVDEKLRHEITPKNILMIGPTGVGKTEIARRLAKLADADIMIISCARLIRIDFNAAGTVLNWVTAREVEGRQVQFSDVHRLVAAFFNVIGISEHARITIRNE